MYDAFISYSHSDLPVVQDLKRLLDDRRLRVFLDTASLRAGKDWPPQLGAGIQASRMMVLCWSAQAASSDWVKSEINHSLSSKRPVPVLSWLLDQTPLPAMLQKTQGITGADPAPVVEFVAKGRRRHQRRVTAAVVACGVILAPAVWWAPRMLTAQSITFRGHISDEQGNAIAGATVAADGIRVNTNASGGFDFVLRGTASRRPLQVNVKKPGYREKTVDTQSDVPDLGVVLERDQ